MVSRAAFLIQLLWLSTQSNAAFYQSAADLPKTPFDFIVVGGGAGGAVVANRLTENSKVNVLLLEAGGLDSELAIHIPFFCISLSPGGPVDWNYTTVAQPGLNGRTVPYPRGFVIGGSTSINYMAYTRTSADDYNRYAAVSGDPGWSWNSLGPYFAKNEKFSPPSANITSIEGAEYNPALHSTTGINSVSLNGEPTGFDPLIKKATTQVPGFQFNLDMNSGNSLGVGHTQSTIGGGARSSSATSYLGTKFITRPNLSVLLNARVTRILKTGTANSLPTFQGVEFTQNGGATKIVYNATKEVILSAGSINTPSILMHSGIGDTTALKSLGITTLVNNPSVGRNLTEHPLAALVWSVNSTDTFEKFDRTSDELAAAEQQWLSTKTGPLANNLLSWLGFFRLNSTFLKPFGDSSSGPNTPHYELLFVNGINQVPPPATGNFMSIGIAALQPTSRGSVTINSADPLAPPVINPNLLGTAFDLATMREAVAAARRFVAAPAFKGYVLGEVLDATDVDAFLKETTAVVFHPVATTSMSPKGAKWGVVDPDLRVKGANNLRIVDAGVLPYIPSGHTQVPTYVFAERASDLIKSLWKI